MVEGACQFLDAILPMTTCAITQQFQAALSGMETGTGVHASLT